MHSEMLAGTSYTISLVLNFEKMVFNFTFFYRLIGLCLLQNELFPLFLQRHVLKFILGRPIRFHDLAFFDPVVYESLRQLVTESTKTSGSILASLDLTFM